MGLFDSIGFSNYNQNDPSTYRILGFSNPNSVIFQGYFASDFVQSSYRQYSKDQMKDQVTFSSDKYAIRSFTADSINETLAVLTNSYYSRSTKLLTNQSYGVVNTISNLGYANKYYTEKYFNTPLQASDYTNANLGDIYHTVDGKVLIQEKLNVAPSKILTDYEVKSKTLTLATSSTPAIDFESGVNITYTLTTALAGNFFPTVTMSNIRDGGRYAIRFNAVHTGNVFTFPAGVYKKDGTAFGAYSVVSEILDFVAIGSNLYCVNK